MKIFNIVGARPNFMKIAPLMEAMGKFPNLQPILIHTGQHYDEKMSQIFFNELGLPKPAVDLGVGSGSQAEQTTKIMVAFEKLCVEQSPDLVLVVGDVNSTLACSLVAAKLGIRLVHVEAGLRSRDRTMPEEINRLVTDTLADLLFTTSREANQNLKAEGISEEKIFFVGNVMVDTLLKHRHRASQLEMLTRLGLQGQEKHYAVMTLHRPANVDNVETLSKLLAAVEVIQQEIPVVFPVHPRTFKQIETLGLRQQVSRMQQLIVLEPLGYLEFLAVLSQAQMVLTDSGGLQEETTVLGIPCLTLRENTERPVTIWEGTNTLVGMKTEKIVEVAWEVLKNGGKTGRVPEFWDGKAAERIVNVLRRGY